MKNIKGAYRGTSVSTVCYEIIKRNFPKASLEQFEFVGYLAFAEWYDKSSGQLLIPWQVIARIERKPFLHNTSNFLRLFSLQVMDIKYSTFSWAKGESRMIISCDWPDEVREAIRLEREGVWKNEQQVWINNGSKITPESQKQKRDQDMQFAIKTMADTGVEDAKTLINYLHELPAQVGNANRKYYDEALALAKSFDEPVRSQQLNILHNYYIQTAPVYTTTQGTTRIFPINASVGMMKKELRRCLTRDWVELDLASAQFSVIGKIWNIPFVVDFLKKGGKPYRYICESLGFAYTEENKQVIKDATFALIFGAGKKTVANALSQMADEKGIEERFLKIDLVRHIYDARMSELARIKAEGGSKNFYGQWLESSKMKNKELSVLASVAQSYELALLKPIVDLAIEYKESTHKFQISLFQHDGLSLSFKMPIRAKQWVERIQKLVDERAKELDIYTSLEVAYAPEYMGIEQTKSPKAAFFAPIDAVSAIVDDSAPEISAYDGTKTEGTIPLKKLEEVYDQLVEKYEEEEEEGTTVHDIVRKPLRSPLFEPQGVSMDLFGMIDDGRKSVKLHPQLMTYYYKSPKSGSWYICESHTELAIGNGDTLAEAKKQSLDLIQKYGIQRILKQIQQKSK